MTAPTPVPLLDLGPQWQALREELLAAIESVCASQRFILGPEVAAFEADMADYCGVAHGVGTSSGSDALLLALMALEVGPGDAVLTTPYSFFATAGSVARLGARPVFCDIDEETFNLCPTAVERFLAQHCVRTAGETRLRHSGERLRVLLPVHLFGRCADLDALMPLAHDWGLAVVEDAAQAIGAQWPEGGRAGARGTIGCFSFFPTKNLGAFGDAGLCTTADAALADRMRLLRVHGARPKYHHALLGANLRLDTLQAAILRVKLRYLEDWTAARIRNASRYRHAFEARGLDRAIRLPPEVGAGRQVFNQYVIRSPGRDALRAHLGACGIGTEIYYPEPLHLQPCFAALGHRPGDCPVAEAACLHGLALPIHPDLEPAQIDAVVAAIAAAPA